MKPKETKNIAHSIRSRLLAKANNNGPLFQRLMIRFVHERFLYRLSKSKYAGNLVLKGGNLLFIYLGNLSRPTKDIDFLGINIKNDRNYLKEVIKEICDIEVEPDGIEFDTTNILDEEITIKNKYPGVRISLIALISTMRVSLKFDIGFGDIVIPGPDLVELKPLLENFQTALVKAYPLETLFAEKLETMFTKGILNSRMKDYYDLYWLIKTINYNENRLERAIIATFSNRNTEISNERELLKNDLRKNAELNMRWEYFLKEMKEEEMTKFSDVVTEIFTFIDPLLDSIQNKK